MPRERLITKTGQFTRWGHRLGFSFKEGDLMGELHPERDDTGLLRWHGYLWWKGTSEERVAEVWEDTHWHGADAMREVARDIIQQGR